MMKLFIIALRHEAQVLIDTFSLQQYARTPFPTYRNDDVTVVISGIGSIQSAAATSFALSTFENVERIINYGTCAAHPRMADAYGRLYSIKKIVDACTQKVFHLTYKEERLPAGTLYTFPKIQIAPSQKVILADMEASGFYLAASHFLEKEKISVWKLVTDWMEDKRIGMEPLQQMQQRHLPLLQEILEV